MLRQQLVSEMKKAGTIEISDLQYLELRREDNSAHILLVNDWADYLESCVTGTESECNTLDFMYQTAEGSVLNPKAIVSWMGFTQWTVRGRAMSNPRSWSQS